jgi:hypothetical protein
MRSAKLGNNKVNAKRVKTPNAMARPHSLAWTTQSPPTTAKVEKSAKVLAIPMSKGRVLFLKGSSDLLKTKGRTGRIQGLKIVNIPPK